MCSFPVQNGQSGSCAGKSVTTGPFAALSNCVGRARLAAEKTTHSSVAKLWRNSFTELMLSCRLDRI